MLEVFCHGLATFLLPEVFDDQVADRLPLDLDRRGAALAEEDDVFVADLGDARQLARRQGKRVLFEHRLATPFSDRRHLSPQLLAARLDRILLGQIAEEVAEAVEEDRGGALARHARGQLLLVGCLQDVVLLARHLPDAVCEPQVAKDDGQATDARPVVGLEAPIDVVFGHADLIVDELSQRDRRPDRVVEVNFLRDALPLGGQLDPSLDVGRSVRLRRDRDFGRAADFLLKVGVGDRDLCLLARLLDQLAVDRSFEHLLPVTLDAHVGQLARGDLLTVDQGDDTHPAFVRVVETILHLGTLLELVKEVVGHQAELAPLDHAIQ